MPAEIRFYRANEKPYGVFSNLHRREFQFEGMKFSTREHAYQYGKPRKPAVRDWLMAAPSPSLLAMAAHGLYSWDIAPGWSQAKVGRMRQVLYAFLCQHEDVRELLISTGDATIIEAATVDNDVNRFWGIVPSGEGKNTLGRLYMDLRKNKIWGSPCS